MFRRCLALAGALSAGGSIYTYCNTSHNILHQWGNGDYNPRPEHPEDLLNFTNFIPRTISYFKDPTSPNLVKVAFGPKSEAALDDKGNIYVWPIHVVNGIGLPDVDDRQRDVKQLTSEGNYIQVKFVKENIYALNKNGEVWVWRFDQSSEPKPRKIPRLQNITKIDTGRDHFVALDKEGSIWTMGDDTFGQCGIESYNRAASPPFLERRYPNPIRVVKVPGKAIDIQCGKDHTVALFDDYTVFSWGKNNKQQVGLILENDNKTLKHAIYEPYYIAGLDEKKVIKIAAGDAFTLFVTETRVGEHEVYGTGLNSRGQLGLGYLTHCTSAVKIQQLSNFVVNDPKTGAFKTVKFSQLECGGEHCMALMDVGAVYIWGGNEHGEQGNKKRTIQDKPRLLKHYRDKEVISINCGQNSSAVIWRSI